MRNQTKELRRFNDLLEQSEKIDNRAGVTSVVPVSFATAPLKRVLHERAQTLVSNTPDNKDEI